MDGCCYGCGTKFNFLKKSVGCCRCGLAFCRKCCSKAPTSAPTGNNQTICRNCVAMASSGCSGNKDPVAMTTPVVPVCTGAAAAGHRKTPDHRLDPEDMEIARRLDALRCTDHVTGSAEKQLTVDEIGTRLALLKGERVHSNQTKHVFHTTDSRTDQEKIDALISETNEELHLEGHRRSEEEEGASAPSQGGVRNPMSERKNCAARKMNSKQRYPLAELDHMVSDDSDSNSGSDGDTAAARKLIQSIVDEQALDDRMASEGHLEVLQRIREKSRAATGDDGSEGCHGDWCTICNNDAVLRCISCDNDLYCNYCFHEGHELYGLQGHSAVKYFPPN